MDESVSKYENAEILQITFIDYRDFEEIFDQEQEYQDWNLCYWVRFCIRIIHTFEIRKSIKYCGSTRARLAEELNQKWIFYKKIFLRGVKGITKGNLSWNQIKKEIYDREAVVAETIETIDDEELFEMNIHNFWRMINVTRSMTFTKKKKKSNYKTNKFPITKEFIVQPKVSCQTMIDLRDKGFDFGIAEGCGEILLIDENKRKFGIRNNSWLGGVCKEYEKKYADYYGILIRLIVFIRDTKQ
jgi:hypothetical protein